MKPVSDSLGAPEIGRRKALLGLVFGTAAAFAAWRLPRKHLDYLGHEKLDDLVPKMIGPWKFVAASGLVIPPEDQLSRLLYAQLLTRVYSDGDNPPVMLLIAQSGSQTGVLQVHRPEICYTTGGYQVSPLGSHAIRVGSSIVKANSLDATAGAVTEHVLYWTRVGDRIPASWSEQKIAVAEQNLRGIIPDAVLVRVSTLNPDATAARATLDTFTRALIASVPLARRSVLIV